MEYVNYEYYINEYKGTLDSNLFNTYSPEAIRTVKRNVNKKLELEDITNEVKDVMCELVDLIAMKKQSDNNKLSSISIDGVNKTFRNISDNEYKDNREEILNHLPQKLIRYI